MPKTSFALGRKRILQIDAAELRAAANETTSFRQPATGQNSADDLVADFLAEIDDLARNQKAAQKNEWRTVTDASSGEVYYWNVNTGATTWDVPTVVGKKEATVAAEAHNKPSALHSVDAEIAEISTTALRLLEHVRTVCATTLERSIALQMAVETRVTDWQAGMLDPHFTLNALRAIGCIGAAMSEACAAANLLELSEAQTVSDLTQIMPSNKDQDGRNETSSYSAQSELPPSPPPPPPPPSSQQHREPPPPPPPPLVSPSSAPVVKTSVPAAPASLSYPSAVSGGMSTLQPNKRNAPAVDTTEAKRPRVHVSEVKKGKTVCLVCGRV